MAFFDIVKEQQNTEELKKHKLIGIDFLGEEVEVEANTSFMFNLIVSMSEEINALNEIDVDVDKLVDIDELVDSMDIENKNGIKDTKVITNNAIKSVKSNLKKQLKGNNIISELSNSSKKEDKVYEKYFFELPGVPTKEEFFKRLAETRGMEFTSDSFEIFQKMALLNKEPYGKQGKKMNLYEVNLYEISKCVEETTGMAINFSNRTKGDDVDSAF